MSAQNPAEETNAVELTDLPAEPQELTEKETKKIVGGGVAKNLDGTSNTAPPAGTVPVLGTLPAKDGSVR